MRVEPYRPRYLRAMLHVRELRCAPATASAAKIFFGGGGAINFSQLKFIHGFRGPSRARPILEQSRIAVGRSARYLGIEERADARALREQEK